MHSKDVLHNFSIHYGSIMHVSGGSPDRTFPASATPMNSHTRLQSNMYVCRNIFTAYRVNQPPVDLLSAGLAVKSCALVRIQRLHSAVNAIMTSAPYPELSYGGEMIRVLTATVGFARVSVAGLFASDSRPVRQARAVPVPKAFELYRVKLTCILLAKNQ